jgi:hypothetical protein
MTSGALVDREQCLMIIDQMRVTIPQQIAEARRIQEERGQIIARAEQEALMIIERGQEEALQALDERGLLREAHERSAEVAEEAERQAEETMRGADEYAIRVLGELEDQLIALQTTIRNGLEILQQDSRMARLGPQNAPQDSPEESFFEQE